MSIFGNILGKIFHHGAAKPAPTTTQADPSPAPAAPQAAPQHSAPVAEAAPAPQAVDVGAVLGEMAAMKNGGGNYQSSIVDLLKLLDLDSSLAARK